MHTDLPRSAHYEFHTGGEPLPLGVELGCVGFKALEKGESFSLPGAAEGLLVLACAQGPGEIVSKDGEWPLGEQEAIVFEKPAFVTARAGQNAPFAVFYAVLRERIGVFGSLPAQGEAFDGAPVLERLGELFGDARRYRLTNRYQRAHYGFGLMMACCSGMDPEAEKPYPPLVKCALGIIEEEYPYIFGVAELAESLEVSKHHLIRQFTRATGVSPGKKLAQTRVHHAKRLLKSGEYGVEIVGQMVGFANGNYFSKVFRGQTGLSPKEYRKKFGDTGGSLVNGAEWD